MTQSNSEQLEAALKKAVSSAEFSIPAYPAAALRLQKAASDPSASVGKVAELVAADPVLAISVLSAANSALRGGDAEIVTVPRAVNRLGIQTVATIAVAVGLGQGALGKGALFDAKYRAWRRSLTAALLGQALAPARGLEADDAFLMGLLSGVGRSVALAALEKIIQKHKPSRPLEVADWLKLAERHRTVLASLAVKKWKLPAPFMALFKPEDSDEVPLVKLSLRAEELAVEFDTGALVVALDPAEDLVLERMFAELPRTLLALAPPPEATGFDPKVIAPPLSSEHFSAPPAELVVSDLRAHARAELECTGVTELLLRVMSSKGFQTGSVVHLSLERADAVHTFWFNVRSSVEMMERHLVEFVLFSAGKEQRELFKKLLAP